MTKITHGASDEPYKLRLATGYGSFLDGAAYVNPIVGAMRGVRRIAAEAVRETPLQGAARIIAQGLRRAVALR